MSDLLSRLRDRYQVGMYRPYWDEDNQAVVEVEDDTEKTPGGSPFRGTVPYARSREILDVGDCVLTRQEWESLDKAAAKQFTLRTRFVEFLKEKGSVFASGGSGTLAAKTILESQTLEEGQTSEPAFKLQSLPLPFTYSDSEIHRCELLCWRDPKNAGAAYGAVGEEAEEINKIASRMPFSYDWVMQEASARKTGEAVERAFLGISEPFVNGDRKVYGVLNHPQLSVIKRSDPLDKRLLMDMVDCLNSQCYYGPYALIYNSTWHKDGEQEGNGRAVEDLIESAYSGTRDRHGYVTIVPWKDGPDILPISCPHVGDSIVLVQITGDVIQVVNAMDFAMLQWGTTPDKVQMKAACIVVPRTRTGQMKIRSVPVDTFGAVVAELSSDTVEPDAVRE